MKHSTFVTLTLFNTIVEQLIFTEHRSCTKAKLSALSREHISNGGN